MIRITVKVEDSSGISAQNIQYISDLELEEARYPLHRVVDKIRSTTNTVIDAIEKSWVEKPE